MPKCELFNADGAEAPARELTERGAAGGTEADNGDPWFEHWFNPRRASSGETNSLASLDQRWS